MSFLNVGYPMRGAGPMMGAGQMRGTGPMMGAGQMRGSGPMMGSRMQYGTPNYASTGYQPGAMRGSMMSQSGAYMNPQKNQMRGQMNYASMPMRSSPMNAAAMYQRHSTMHSGYNRPGYW
jgi:hypothetical protein